MVETVASSTSAQSHTVSESLDVDSAFLPRLHGWFHRCVLFRVSAWYCRWRGLTPEWGILPLPFNLLLKSTHKTRLQEAYAMAFARKIGIPAPRFIAYGAPRPGSPGGSILMSRIPGRTVDELREFLTPPEIDIIKTELTTYIERMRTVSSSWGDRVCSIVGGPVYGSRVPNSEVGPCADERAFHDEFLKFANPDFWHESIPLDEVLSNAKRMLDIPHRIVFTHGDLLGHNIMVHNGHISGIIDWEFAGWMPEYWEYTQMLRTYPFDTWWMDIVMSLPGYKYQQELVSGQAMWHLAADSLSW